MSKTIHMLNNNRFTKQDIVDKILCHKTLIPKRMSGHGFASSNIALCKYWGKRDSILNLPETNSLSISLGDYGAKTQISLTGAKSDRVYLNEKPVPPQDSFAKSISLFLDLFRLKDMHYKIETELNIPVSAGLASSSCGFAALVLAINDLYAWDLPLESLSILGRLGSGSACRSFLSGFVEWEKGKSLDGMDSYGRRIPKTWGSLRIGLCIIDEEPKKISSREAMARTVQTSPFYKTWVDRVPLDLEKIKTAIHTENFTLLGETAESNALSMHALMQTASPPIVYSLPETLSTMETLWTLRKEGIEVYFTQDAGPNLKLLFLSKNADILQQRFPNMILISPFQEEEVS